MLKGISNFQIESAIKNLNNDDLNENSVGVFPANHMSKFIDFKSLISEKKQERRKGTHWWSILDIEPKRDLFFIHLESKA